MTAKTVTLRWGQITIVRRRTVLNNHNHCRFFSYEILHVNLFSDRFSYRANSKENARKLWHVLNMNVILCCVTFHAATQNPLWCLCKTCSLRLHTTAFTECVSGVNILLSPVPFFFTNDLFPYTINIKKYEVFLVPYVTYLVIMQDCNMNLCIKSSCSNLVWRSRNCMGVRCAVWRA